MYVPSLVPRPHGQREKHFSLRIRGLGTRLVCAQLVLPIFGANLEQQGIPWEIPAHSAVTWFVYNLATASLVVEQRNEMALSKFQGAVLACNPLTEETLAARVKAHYSEFLAYTSTLWS